MKLQTMLKIDRHCPSCFSIRSIVCLNLPSFSGGLNPWGTPGTRKVQDVSLPSLNLLQSPLLYLWPTMAYYGQRFTSSHGNMQRDLTPPYVDDSLIEVVGFRDAWHGLVLLAPNGHGTRLAQVSTPLLYQCMVH